MSAFIVSKECMNRVVAAICYRSRYGQVIRTFDGIATDSKGAATEIGRRLFTLNVEAIYQRYPDTLDAPDNMPGPVDKSGKSTALRDAARFVALPVHVDLVAAVKAMNCLSYQCAEGDVPETPLYKELERAIGEIACEFVRRQPAYDAAAWG